MESGETEVCTVCAVRQLSVGYVVGWVGAEEKRFDSDLRLVRFHV